MYICIRGRGSKRNKNIHKTGKEVVEDRNGKEKRKNRRMQNGNKVQALLDGWKSVRACLCVCGFRVIRHSHTHATCFELWGHFGFFPPPLQTCSLALADPNLTSFPWPGPPVPLVCGFGWWSSYFWHSWLVGTCWAKFIHHHCFSYFIYSFFFMTSSLLWLFDSFPPSSHLLSVLKSYISTYPLLDSKCNYMQRSERSGTCFFKWFIVPNGST